MIYTLTLNPSIDYHIWLSSFKEDSINPVKKEWKDAGGKGINVSKVLNGLGMTSTILGFIGGFTGTFIQQQVESLGIPHRFIRVEEDSRINVKMKAEVETEFSGVSPAISADALASLFMQLNSLTGDDYLVLAGSVPSSIPANIYQTILERLQPVGARIFLDAKGKALRDSLSARPFLIKPNHHELSELFGVKVATPTEAIVYGRKAIEMGAQNVIVSLAGQGAIFVNQAEAYIAQIPQRQPVNSIGAGDSMVAGFLYMYEQTKHMESAFRFAVAAGSSTALSEGFCTPETIEAFLPEVNIIKMS